jgi:hypothetical protein
MEKTSIPDSNSEQWTTEGATTTLCGAAESDGYPIDRGKNTYL